MIPPGRREGVRIAIVEDDMPLRESLAFFFRAKGYHVETFGCAEDAAGIGGRDDFDAVICDYLLPGDDGLSVLRHVREGAGKAVTVLITAYSGVDVSRLAESACVDRILFKPFSTSELEDTLKALAESPSGPAGAVGPLRDPASR